MFILWTLRRFIAFERTPPSPRPVKYVILVFSDFVRPGGPYAPTGNTGAEPPKGRAPMKAK
jgi:hypothetical protein